jgi:predicted RNA-binding protein with RPS1 domain
MSQTPYQIFRCKVLAIKPTFALLEHQNTVGLCHISEISDYHVKDIHNYLTEGQYFDFALFEFDVSNKNYKFSYIVIHPKML